MTCYYCLNNFNTRRKIRRRDETVSRSYLKTKKLRSVNCLYYTQFACWKYCLWIWAKNNTIFKWNDTHNVFIVIFYVKAAINLKQLLHENLIACYFSFFNVLSNYLENILIVIIFIAVALQVMFPLLRSLRLNAQIFQLAPSIFFIHTRAACLVRLE